MRIISYILEFPSLAEIQDTDDDILKLYRLKMRFVVSLLITFKK